MPGIDGFEVLRQLRAWPAHQRPRRIAVVSAAEKTPDLLRLLCTYSVDAITKKPFAVADLAPLLDSLADELLST